MINKKKLKSLKLNELKNLAKKIGIKGFSKLKKDLLLDLIEKTTSKETSSKKTTSEEDDQSNAKPKSKKILSDLSENNTSKYEKLGFEIEEGVTSDDLATTLPRQSLVSQLDGSLMNNNTDLAIAAYNADKNANISGAEITKLTSTVNAPMAERAEVVSMPVVVDKSEIKTFNSNYSSSLGSNNNYSTVRVLGLEGLF